MTIHRFRISGHSTKREWAVYVFLAIPVRTPGENFKLYVGKTGDNRDGCNPVISRVGNHFSFNEGHAQIRKLIKQTEDYDYEYFYCHFGAYEKDSGKREMQRSRINELERELNRITQAEIENRRDLELLNPYTGKYTSKEEKDKRSKLISEEDKCKLQVLVNEVMEYKKSIS